MARPFRSRLRPRCSPAATVASGRWRGSTRSPPGAGLTSLQSPLDRGSTVADRPVPSPCSARDWALRPRTLRSAVGPLRSGDVVVGWIRPLGRRAGLTVSGRSVGYSANRAAGDSTSACGWGCTTGQVTHRLGPMDATVLDRSLPAPGRAGRGIGAETVRSLNRARSPTRGAAADVTPGLDRCQPPIGADPEGPHTKRRPSCRAP
jgi:hypothetical protein